MVRLWISMLALIVDVLMISSVAQAAVRKDGRWPEADKTVTFDFSGGSREEAVKKLADAAGWSLVLQTKLDAVPDPIDIHVKNQPAGKVLDLILGTGNYVATRDDTLISITRDTSTHAGATALAAPPIPSFPVFPAIPPVPPVPPVPSVPPSSPETPAAHGKHHHGEKGEDRVITGGSLTILKGETVHDVVLFGGSVDVYGNVTGDIAVTGGSVRVHDGAHVGGDATTMGGSLTVDDGAEVEGDVAVMGGSLKRGDRALIGGNVVRGNASGAEDTPKGTEDAPPKHGSSKIGRFVQGAGSAITKAAVLFIFGAVLLALGTKRMETLRAEVATRPMRSFAVGLVGSLGLGVLLVVLSVTIIGIPVVLLALPLLVFGGYAGLVAALSTAGEGLLRHRTQNAYVHLAAGCALFVLLGALPYVGHMVTIFAALVGIGVVIATRAAGMLPTRAKPGSSPTYAATV